MFGYLDVWMFGWLTDVPFICLNGFHGLLSQQSRAQHNTAQQKALKESTSSVLAMSPHSRAARSSIKIAYIHRMYRMDSWVDSNIGHWKFSIEYWALRIENLEEWLLSYSLLKHFEFTCAVCTMWSALFTFSFTVAPFSFFHSHSHFHSNTK